jgi:peroxiredoxin
LSLLSDHDRQYVRANGLVVIKQFELSTERKGFKKELKLLKRIKQLQL